MPSIYKTNHFMTLTVLLVCFLALSSLPVLAGSITDLQKNLSTQEIEGCQTVCDENGNCTTVCPSSETQIAPSNCPGGVCPPSTGLDLSGLDSENGIGGFFQNLIQGIMGFIQKIGEMFKNLFSGITNNTNNTDSTPPPVDNTPTPTPEPTPVNEPTPTTTETPTPTTTTPEPPATPTPTTPTPTTTTTSSKPQALETLSGSNFPVPQSQGLFIVDFYAPWCGPCQSLAPKFERVANQLKSDNSVRFGKLNADNEARLRSQYGVTGYPTIIIFKDGKAVGKQVGGMSEAQLLGLVKKYK